MEFPTQFYLAHSSLKNINKPKNFQTIEKNQFTIAHASNLPIAKFQQNDDCELYVLGWLFYKGELLTSGQSVPKFSKDYIADCPLLTESYGRYLFILFEQGEIFVLPDAAASLSTFYHSKLKFLASTIDLIKCINLPVCTDQSLSALVVPGTLVLSYAVSVKFSSTLNSRSVLSKFF